MPIALEKIAQARRLVDQSIAVQRGSEAAAAPAVAPAAEAPSFELDDADLLEMEVFDGEASVAEGEGVGAIGAKKHKGGIDFNVKLFDIKTTGLGSIPVANYPQVQYSGITLKSVSSQPISPATLLSAWAAQK